MGRQEKIFHQLLCHRRSASVEFATPPGRRHDRVDFNPINPMMLKEARIFRRDRGMNKMWRDIRQADKRVPLLIPFGGEERLNAPLELYSGCQRRKPLQIEQGDTADSIKPSSSHERPAGEAFQPRTPLRQASIRTIPGTTPQTLHLLFQPYAHLLSLTKIRQGGNFWDYGCQPKSSVLR